MKRIKEWVLYLWNKLYYHQAFWPSIITIETCTMCNRKCSHCPNSVYARPAQIIDNAVFIDTIHALAAASYCGKLCLHGYNEPLLDPDLMYRIQYISCKLPRCTQILFTNGDYLSEKKRQDLVKSGIKHFIINKVPDKLSNRGGIMKSIPPEGFKTCPACFQMVINCDGETVLCCSDYFSQYKYGKISELGFIAVLDRMNICKQEVFDGNFRKPICLKCVGAKDD